MSDLSATEFGSIAAAVAAERSGIASASIAGFEVQLMIWSGSRKVRWQADFVYEPQTRHWMCRAAYPEAKELRWFIDDVNERISMRT